MKNKKKKLLVVATLFSFLILANALNFNFCCYGMTYRERYREINSNNNELNNNLNNLNNRDRRKQLDKAIQENDLTAKWINKSNKCIDKLHNDISLIKSDLENLESKFTYEVTKKRLYEQDEKDLITFDKRWDANIKDPWDKQSCCSCLLI